MKKSATILLLSIGMIVIAGVGVEVYQQHRVDSFFRQFVSLQLGKTSLRDVQQFAAQYGARKSGIQVDEACTAQTCEVTLAFRNWIFRHLQSDREISLTAGLFFKDGYLTSKEIDFSIASH